MLLIYLSEREFRIRQSPERVLEKEEIYEQNNSKLVNRMPSSNEDQMY
jgi:hypothetical protein